MVEGQVRHEEPETGEPLTAGGWWLSVIDEVPGVIFAVDRSLRVRAVGGCGLKTAGLDAAKLLGEKVASITAMLDLEPLILGLLRRALEGQEARVELTWKERDYELCVSPLKDPAGRVIGCVGIGLDATERRRAERDAVALARRLAEAEQVASVGSWEWNLASNRVIWSETLWRLHGISEEAREGPPEQMAELFVSAVHPDDRARIGEEMAQIARSPGPFAFEYRTLWPDGNIRVLFARGEVIRGPDGLPERLIGATHDITETRRAAEQREHALSLLRSTLESTADGILVVDRQGKFAGFNQRFAEMWRIPPELASAGDDDRALAFVLTQLVDPDGFVRKVRELYQHPDQDSFDVLEFKDGRVFERLSRPQRLNGEVVGRVWSFRDVTDYRRALRARDDFLSVASHELRTPLATLHLGLRVLERDLARQCEDSPELARHLASVGRQIDRMSRLTAEMLDVSRIDNLPLQLNLEPLDLVELAHEVTNRFVPEAGGQTEIRVLASGPLFGRWDRSRLDQILTNLVSNAVRYGRGRPIEVKMDRVGERVRVTVADQGIGIATDRLPFIFKRYERAVSTREYGGLGLGLYIVAKLVERFGGTVSARSELGVGTAFTVELPLSSPEQA